MHFINIFKSIQSGRSMIEMLGVLAIIGILSAGGIAGYSSAMDTYKVNKFFENTSISVTQANTFFQKKKGVVTLSLSNLCSLGIIKTNVCNTGKGVFGGDFDVLLTASAGTKTSNVIKNIEGDTIKVQYPAAFFTFTFSALPVSVCKKLFSSQLWLNVGVLADSASSNGVTRSELPLNTNDAVNFCNNQSASFRVYVWINHSGIVY